MNTGCAGLQNGKSFLRLRSGNAEVISSARDLGIERRFDLAKIFVKRPDKHGEFTCSRLKNIDKILQILFHVSFWFYTNSPPNV